MHVELRFVGAEMTMNVHIHTGSKQGPGTWLPVPIAIIILPTAHYYPSRLRVALQFVKRLLAQSEIILASS